MPNQSKPSVPFAAQAVPFDELLATGKIPADYVSSEYVAQQFVERRVLIDLPPRHVGQRLAGNGRRAAKGLRRLHRRALVIGAHGAGAEQRGQ